MEENQNKCIEARSSTRLHNSKFNMTMTPNHIQIDLDPKEQKILADLIKAQEMKGDQTQKLSSKEENRKICGAMWKKLKSFVMVEKNPK